MLSNLAFSQLAIIEDHEVLGTCLHGLYVLSSEPRLTCGPSGEHAQCADLGTNRIADPIRDLDHHHSGKQQANDKHRCRGEDRGDEERRHEREDEPVEQARRTRT